MRKVRVGIIGAGGVAQSRHLPRLASIDEVDLACIWSRDSIKATKVAKDFEIPKPQETKEIKIVNKTETKKNKM